MREVGSPRSWAWRIAALLAVVGLITACSGGGASTTTTAGPTTTAPDGDTTTTAAPSPEDELLERAKSRSYRVGITGEGVFHRDGRITGYQMNKIPLILAIEQLNAEGWDIAPIFLNQSEAPIQALLQGSIDVANSSVTPVITSVAAGAPIKSFAKSRNVEYVMLTTVDINGPEDLHGKRVGLHAAASTTTLLTRLFLRDHPEVEPNYLIVPGSGNRIQAMLAGELDATAAQFGDDTAAMEEAPGKFHVIFDFSKELPELVDSVYSYNAEQLDDELRLFLEYMLAYSVQMTRKIFEDPEWALQKATEHEVQETSGLQRYIDSEIWPRDHGLDTNMLDLTIQGLVDAELIPAEGAPTGADFFDGSIWEGAKQILGE